MSLGAKHSATPSNIFTLMTNLARQEGAHNLSQGLPDYPVAPELSHFLEEAVLRGVNQYAPMPGLTSLREGIARDLNERYQTTYCTAEFVTVTPGATYGIFTALATLIDKGDEVIYFEPAFDCYLPAIEINGGVPVRITLEASDGFAINWQLVREKITQKTKAFLINTPHNPTGYVWTQADWDALAALIEDKELYVIADEVYDSIVFDGACHLPGFLQPALRDRLISIYSFGKSFHITGWKIGYCIAGTAISAAFRSIHQYLSFSVNAPAQYALTRYLDQYQKRGASIMLEAKRDLLLEGLAHSRFQPLAVSKGTYFQLYDYSAISDLNDLDFAQWLTRTHKVATIPLSAFYRAPRSEKWVRFCFAKKDEVLKAVAQILSTI